MSHKRVPRLWKVCKFPYCRQLFYATRRDQLYCSGNCKTRAWAHRHGYVMRGMRGALTQGEILRFYNRRRREQQEQIAA